MKARFQVSIPTTDLAYPQMMYDIAEYLQSTGDQIRPEILEQVVEDPYKIIPPFFLKGSKSKAGRVLSSRPMRWDAREYDILGLILYCVISPNRIFIFSSEPIQSEGDLYNILAADPDFYSEDYEEDYEKMEFEENPPMTMAPWVQWAMWGLHTAGMFLSNPPPRITEELVGHHHGQNDLILNAYGPETNQLLGYISYSEFPAGSNKIQVNWMYVSGAMRRRGIGTLLVLALQDKYKKINWGFTTPEGTGLLKKIEALKSQKMAFLPGGKPNSRNPPFQGHSSGDAWNVMYWIAKDKRLHDFAIKCWNVSSKRTGHPDAHVAAVEFIRGIKRDRTPEGVVYSLNLAAVKEAIRGLVFSHYRSKQKKQKTSKRKRGRR